MGLLDVEKFEIPSNLLKDRFVVPPFSVLNTMAGYWQERKKQWMSLGIKSELGRDDVEGTKCNPTGMGEKYGRSEQLTGTSVFDPVLTEICYRWFSRKGDKVIDPFAGGSVRGVVANILGREYTGIDLSEAQVAANRQQAEELMGKYAEFTTAPNWIHGDSMNVKPLTAGNRYNMLMTCPPYYDLEVYSDKEEDLSNQRFYSDFLRLYKEIIARCYDVLYNDSFACITIGEVRHKDGEYQNFVGDTITAFLDAGFKYYNEMILVTVAGTLPLRVGMQFNAGRKIGKQHQNVLVFYKGDTNNISEKFGEVVVDGMFTDNIKK